jgi:predicted enzyme related to lactoylglutathione lyase
VHFEVAAADDGLLVAFYGGLFGWRLQDPSGSGYTMIDTCAGHGINGGIARSRHGEPWSTFYVEVEDLQATLDKANSLGGTTVLPVTDLAGAATTAMFKDPDGLPVGLVRAPAETSRVYASAPSAGSGEMLDWFEVMGSDAARTQHFYAELFDWALDDAGFPDYAVVDTGTARGIQGGLGGVRGSRWTTTYAWVADLDQTFSRVEKLGGSRILDQEVPDLKNRSRLVRFGVLDNMKTGAFRDPAGNVFGVFELNPEA